MSMEAGAEQADVRLTTWPGGESRVLARATFHGPPVRWLGADRGQRFGLRLVELRVGDLAVADLPHAGALGAPR